jgi:transcription antitermination factor NusG
MHAQQSETFLTKELAWFAVSTRSRQEKTVAAGLERSGIIVFLPLVTEVHQWSDRRKAVSVPLFSGYLFVRLPALSKPCLSVLKVPGVAGFVGDHNGPIPIPDREIDDVRCVLSQIADCAPYPFLKAGDRVRIVGGALDGVEGTLIGRGPGAKLVISIQLIQRSLAVSVYNFNIKPVGGPRGIAA